MKTIFRWIISGYFGLVALGLLFIPGGAVAGVFALIVAVLHFPIPLLQNKISSYIKGKWKVIITVVVVICMGIAIPQEMYSETDRSSYDISETVAVYHDEEIKRETDGEYVEFETMDTSTETDSTVDESAIKTMETTAATTQATTIYAEATTEGYTTVATETYMTDAPTTAATTYNTEHTYTHATTAATEMTTASAEINGRNYVINTNTGKFHYPSCSSVKDIKPENRWDYYGTREDVIGMEYVPCKRCDP